MDLAGNVWEWCLNGYSTPENCRLPGDKTRVVRGGFSRFVPDFVRSTVRNNIRPDDRYYHVGFRVICSFPIG